MAALEGRYDFRTAEPGIQAKWAEAGIYEFDPSHQGKPYVVDTPPPTVSGQIHVGHVYSYAHADIVSRYHRMKGEQVLYPFGFDDNGSHRRSSSSSTRTAWSTGRSRRRYGARSAEPPSPRPTSTTKSG